jgi:anhydro-N-acetylmuramic acid kinase
MSAPPLRALGLMSGTSADGIDIAVIETDGETVSAFGPTGGGCYRDTVRDAVRALYGRAPDRADPAVAALEADIADDHADAVRDLIDPPDLVPIDVIGFHGQTVWHDPAAGVTVQLGDAPRLAGDLGCPVICDFRAADVAAGGQGAPFAPLYHRALAHDLEKPLAVLNLGGVGNVTVLSGDAEDGGQGDDGAGAVSAFDTGPANALLDDWVRRHGRGDFDADGALAAAGRVDEAALARLLDHPYFDAPPPKSLDRQAFSPDAVEGLSVEDGAATLAAFTVAAVVRARDCMAAAPLRWLVTGGGRRNGVLMRGLAEALGAPVEPVESVGWNGDALEAQAFAFLAVRSLYGLPLSLPSTTGVARPMTGGRRAG